ncbi:hypothetical protein PF049_01340 [Erythrobacteraceae bacterium WH01K]|nr:hypothetical protein PF049_01340 [Erythrobacteraceae bacterium WH01K]
MAIFDTRIRPPAAALTRRLAARATRIAVEATSRQRTLPASRAADALWPDLFED